MGLQHASGGGMGVGFTELVGRKNSAACKASAPIALEGSTDLPLLMCARSGFLIPVTLFRHFLKTKITEEHWF